MAGRVVGETAGLVPVAVSAAGRHGRVTVAGKVEPVHGDVRGHAGRHVTDLPRTSADVVRERLHVGEDDHPVVPLVGGTNRGRRQYCGNFSYCGNFFVSRKLTRRFWRFTFRSIG